MELINRYISELQAICLGNNEEALPVELNISLVEKGWIPQTTSTFGYVCISPCGEYVLRIGQDQDEKSPDLYPYYAGNCVIHGEGNPYMPKIYWHVASTLKTALGGHATFTLMERLYLVERGNSKYYQDLDIMRTALPFRAMVWECADTYYVGCQNQKLQEAINHIYGVMAEFSNNACLFISDMKPSNVMVRSDGHPVIIDPYGLMTLENKENSEQ